MLFTQLDVQNSLDCYPKPVDTPPSKFTYHHVDKLLSSCRDQPANIIPQGLNDDDDDDDDGGDNNSDAGGTAAQPILFGRSCGAHFEQIFVVDQFVNFAHRYNVVESTAHSPAC